MMPRWTGSQGGRVFSIDTEYIDVTSPYPTVDTNWVGRCPNRHVTSVETANSKQVKVGECDGTCGAGEPHDVMETEWHCRCGALINPAIIPAYAYQSIPGMTSYTINGEPVTEEQFREEINAEV